MQGVVQAIRVGEERLEWLKELLRQSHRDEQAYHDAQIRGLTARYEQLQQREVLPKNWTGA